MGAGGAGGQGEGLMKHCTVHSDGVVEIRAASGNARLTLSSSRTMVEVDYAATAAATFAAATPATDADAAYDTPREMATRMMRRVREEKEEGEEEAEEEGQGNHGFGHHRSGGGGERKREARRGGREARAATNIGGGGSRVWVNRRFLAGSSFSVPPEFAHALGVAHTVSLSLGSAGEGRGVGVGVGVRAGVASLGGVGAARDGGGVVASELPRPEERPDHVR